MKKNLTELVFILDESGSMCGLKSDTIGGFNSLIEQQKGEDGEAYVSTVLFNHTTKVVHDRVPLSEVEPMTAQDYVPSGSTALYDAVGGAIKHISNIHKYARKEDIPERTLFVITTDGMENSSRSYSQRKVKDLIDKMQRKYGWEFIFLGANIDAAETAGSMGISADNAVNFHADCEGTAVLFGSVNEAVRNVRSAVPLGKAWRSSLDEDFNGRKR